MKRLTPTMRIVLFALLLGVVIPYMSYKLRTMDRCMPEEAGMFYVPVLVPIFELCPLSFVGELGLITVGLPAIVAGLVFNVLTNRTLLFLANDLFCIVPLLFSFFSYVVIVLTIRWTVKWMDRC